MIEIFNPIIGIAFYTVADSRQAKTLCRIAAIVGGMLDYARQGEGWV
jgi:hypothetical protein